MIQTLRRYQWLRQLYWQLQGLRGNNPEKANQRFHLKNQKKLIQEYFLSSGPKKLQIGAQNHALAGWLNADILPKNRQVLYLDATQEFPLETHSFDYIFTEHMIEHIEFDQADAMLRECHRILRKGGKIRIVTPNLKALAELFLDPEKADHQAYLASYFGKYLPKKYPKEPTFVVNRLFYGFHHKFIHSAQSLQFLLEKNGFHSFQEKKIYESEDPHLCHMEQHGQEIGEIPNRVESLIVEAVA